MTEAVGQVNDGQANDGQAADERPPHVWVVRHGETEWSRDGRHTGSTDVPLTRHGEAQAADLAAILAGRGFAAVWVSPRLRARRTAELAGLEVFEVVDDLEEWDYGDYEGLTRADIYRTTPDWDLWRDGCPGGESPHQVSDRVDGVIGRLRGYTGPVLLVAHGHILRSLTARWLHQPVGVGTFLELVPARISILGWDRGTPTLELWNSPSAPAP